MLGLVFGTIMIYPLLGIIVLCYILSKTCKIKNAYAFPIGILFGVFGYSMVPIGETDLTRYYETVSGMEGHSLATVLQNDFENLYTKDILFYLVSRTGDENILAFIVGTLAYGIMFYICFSAMGYYDDISKKDRANIILLMISIISPYMIIGNIRNVLAFEIIFLGYYLSKVKKVSKWITVVLWIIASGLHVSAIILIIVALLLPLLNKFGKIILLVSILLPVLIEQIKQIIDGIATNNFIIEIIRNAVNKAYYYLNWTDGGWADEVSNSLSDRLNRVYGVIFLIIIIGFVFYLMKEYRAKGTNMLSPAMKDCIGFLFIVAVLALGCTAIKTGAFWRFEAIVVVFSPLILLPLLKTNNKFIKYGKTFLYLTSVGMFILNGIIMYRNLVPSETFQNFVLTSPIVLLIKLFLSFIA